MQHALAGVGENLRDHYAPRFVARVKNIDTINERVRGLRLAGEIAKWLFTRKGVLSLSPTHVYCFWRSEPTVANSDLQLTFTPASYREGVQGELEREPGMTVASWQQRPESRGLCAPALGGPLRSPHHPAQLPGAGVRPARAAGRHAARPPAAQVAPARSPTTSARTFPGPGVESDDELLGAAKQRGTTTFHPSGTCRMAPASDPIAVVDDQLRVHGLEGLQGHRRLHHADHALRQPQRRHPDDRREGLRPAAQPHRAPNPSSSRSSTIRLFGGSATPYAGGRVHD